MTNMIIAAFKKNYIGGGNDSVQMMTITKKCAGPGRARAGDGTGINSSLLTSASHVNTRQKVKFSKVGTRKRI